LNDNENTHGPEPLHIHWNFPVVATSIGPGCARPLRVMGAPTAVHYRVQFVILLWDDQTSVSVSFLLN
jgi:hypothetical protein